MLTFYPSQLPYLVGNVVELLELDPTAEIALEPRGIPAIVGVDDIIVPIFVDNPLEVLAVGRL